MDPEIGAAAFCLSNPPPLLLSVNFAALEIFDQAGMKNVTHKQFLLTGFLEYLLEKDLKKVVKIITPKRVQERGSQLSIEFDRDLAQIQKDLEAEKVIVSIVFFIV